MTTPGVPLQADEAGLTAEADWYEANGIEPGAEVQEWAHKLAQDMFAAGVEWAAGRLDGLAGDPKWFTDRYAVRAAAALLRRGPAT